MNVGIIGLSRDGKAVAEHLLGKTARNLFAYDPDGRVLSDGLRMLPTAAELIDRCGRVILAFESPRELTLLLNSVAE